MDSGSFGMFYTLNIAQKLISKSLVQVHIPVHLLTILYEVFLVIGSLQESQYKITITSKHKSLINIK